MRDARFSPHALRPPSSDFEPLEPLSVKKGKKKRGVLIILVICALSASLGLS